jgi:hypothetical protein
MNTIGVLISFWYFRTPSTLQAVRKAADTATANGDQPTIIVDSGAFSADTQGHSITVREYADWLTAHATPTLAHHISTPITLDVLRDAKRSLQNWHALRELGHDTMPVVHLGDNPKTIDPYVEAGADYIGLGAMVGRAADRKIRWAAHVFAHARKHHPHVRFHGLGIGGQKLVEALPWYTVDSSGFGSGYRFARVNLYDPAKRKFTNVHLRDLRSLHKHGSLLRRTYGVNPTDFNVNGTIDTTSQRARIIKLTRASLLKWQEHLQKRQPVPAPKRLNAKGPIIHSAIAGGRIDVDNTIVGATGPIIHFDDAAVDKTVTHINGSHA